MILSVSRRTDIPAFYSDWFINRIKDGYVYVRNPFNANQISKVNIRPEVVDCIVFWTKDAEPLLSYLTDLEDYKYYFQFTINPYGQDLERNVRNKEEVIKTFITLSEMIGPDRVIWRYDPVIITDKYHLDYHFKEFNKLCQKLKDHTSKAVISFLDDYRKVSKNMKGFDVKQITEKDMVDIAKRLSVTAKNYGLDIETCAEAVDLRSLGIAPGRCIDGDLIEKIIGYKIMNKDKRDNNREHCGCMKCIDIGQYDSCVHNCMYCYANINKELSLKNRWNHDPQSPILFGDYDKSKVKDRKDVKSFRIEPVEPGLFG